MREYQSLPAWRRAPLPPDAPPDRRARPRAVLSVRAQAPPAGAADARRLGALAQRHVDQPRDRGGARPPDGSVRRARRSAGAGADHAARLVGRGLAVLRAAPVRAHLLGVGRGLEPPHRRPARQLALRSAARAALVHGQHRHPSHPSSVQSDPLLPARRGAARAPGAARGQSPDAQGELPLPAARAVGRGPAATGGVR